MTYKYTLPDDDQEVIVSAAAMALLDLVKQPLIMERERIEARAFYLCEQTHQHSREPLTNDYESWKQLFIPNFTTIYLQSADKMDLDKMRRIADKYDLLTVLAEYRNLVKMKLFPDLADLSQLIMKYDGVLLAPHRTTDGYYVAFIHKSIAYRTASKPTPTEALREAESIVRQVKQGGEGDIP